MRTNKRLAGALALILVLACLLPLNAAAASNGGSLYNERYAMVTSTDFELYVQGAVSSAPYYGGKFEPRGGTYIGAVPDNAGSLLPLGSYLTYIDGMGQSDLYYPANQMIRSGNVVTMVGWTISSLDTIDYDYVRSMLKNLNDYGKPMLIRFANEMNVSSLGDSPEKYVSVFRRVADMIHEYSNLGVVWSPNDLGAVNKPYKQYYPGDEYVDWVGISCYLRKYFQGNPASSAQDTMIFMTGDNAWATNNVQPFMEFLAQNNIRKPVMLSECGVETENKQGDRHTEWASPRLRNLMWNLIMKYPQIKMVNFFNTNRMKYGEAFGFDVTDHSYAVDIVKEAKQSGAYITEYGQTPSFVFQPANDAGTLTAKDGKVRLYTLAYVYKQPELTVTYTLDGKWYESASKIPYSVSLKLSGLEDGRHTLSISGAGNKKDYTFYKSGQNIAFGKEPDSGSGSSAAPDSGSGSSAAPGSGQLFAVAGEYLNTDIKTFVNGSQIEAINIGGRTLISAEDLQYHGFKVSWNGTERTLRVNRSGSPTGDGPAVKPFSGKIGEPLGKYYYTDIRTYLDGTEITAYNTGGRTYFCAEDMRDYGYNVKYSESQRTLTVTSP